MYHNGDVKKERWHLGTNWLDGGILLDWNFLKKIDFVIKPIEEERFVLHPDISSGVWLQISKKINKLQQKILKPERSLAFHDGNNDSKMNWMCRSKRKIKTLNFS